MEKILRKGRQTVSFTAVNHLSIHVHTQRDYDVTRPRIAVYKQNRKIHKNTLDCAHLRVAEKKGLTVYQTRSSAIILHDTLPAVCIEKVVVMNSGEEFYKPRVSPAPLKNKSLRVGRRKLDSQNPGEHGSTLTKQKPRKPKLRRGQNLPQTFQTPGEHGSTSRERKRGDG